MDIVIDNLLKSEMKMENGFMRFREEDTTSCQNNHAQNLALFFPYSMPWHDQPM